MKPIQSDDGTLDVLNISSDDAAELLRVFTTGKRPTTPGVGALFVMLTEQVQHQQRCQAVAGEVVLDDFVSTCAAADAIGVEQRHVRKLCKERKLRARKLDSGDWLINSDSLADYIAQRLESVS